MKCPECEEGTLICLGHKEEKIFEYECNVCFVIKEFDSTTIIKRSKVELENYLKGEPKWAKYLNSP